MAARVTKDAFIASEFHLYYPQHLLDESLKPYRVPLAFYYYSTSPDYTVDITSFIEDKVKAATKNVSQFPPSLNKYTPEMGEGTFQFLRKIGLSQAKSGDKYVEKFRREENP